MRIATLIRYGSCPGASRVTPLHRMKFHNAPASVYGARMIPAVPRTLLARLRSSARLAVFVLLVFTLKIGAVAACAKHDFADMGMGSGSSQGTEKTDSVRASADVDPTQAQLGHAGACNHCGCHHAAVVVPVAYISLAISANGLTVRPEGLSPSASPPLELRPPIV